MMSAYGAEVGNASLKFIPTGGMYVTVKMWSNNNDGKNSFLSFSSSSSSSSRGFVLWWLLLSYVCMQGRCVVGFVTNHHRVVSRYTTAKVSLKMAHHESSELLGSLLSTMYATGIKQSSNDWSFLWFNSGGSHLLDPHYANGQSIAPIDPDQVGAIKDYFLPTTSEQVTNAAIAAQQKAIQAGASATYDPSDFTILKNGPPAFSHPTMQQTTPTTMGTKPIDANELEWIARTFDIFSRKIPVAALFYALVDFFFIGANDVYKEDLDEDKPVVVADWITQSAARVVAAFVIGTLVIGFENISYHPF